MVTFDTWELRDGVGATDRDGAGMSVSFELFDGRVVHGVTDIMYRRLGDRFEWRGDLVAPAAGRFVMVEREGVVAARVNVHGEGEYALRPIGLDAEGGQRAILEALPPLANYCGGSHGGVGLPEPAELMGSSCGCVDDGSEIDVLVLYSQDAADAYDPMTETAIQAAIDLGVAILNDALDGSLVADLDVNLVDAQVISYTEDPNKPIGDIVDELVDPSDGALDGAHTLRDSLAADLVCFVPEVDGSPNFAGKVSGTAPYDPNVAFFVIESAHVDSTVFAHEVGHLMGATHDDGGYFGYMHGIAFTSQDGNNTPYRTIMSQVAGHLTTHHFSTPDVVVAGVTIGQTGVNDFATAAEMTKVSVANFRHAGSACDCNQNGVADATDISSMTSDDDNSNGVPDECEVTVFVDGSLTGVGDGLSWSTAFNDLGFALDKAALNCNEHSSEFWVREGTYLRSNQFSIASEVAMYGGFDGTETSRDQRDPVGNPTILSGDDDMDDSAVSFDGNGIPSISGNTNNAVRLFRFDTTDQAIIDGFIIEAGHADPDIGVPAGGGGGASLDSGGKVEFRDCWFTGNESGLLGGAVDIQGEGSYWFDRCVFKANVSNRGGAVGGGPDTAGALFTQCDFIDNGATTAGGGAVYIQGGTWQFDGCRFISNSGALSGGGGAVRMIDGEALFQDCLLVDNLAVGVGGAASVTGDATIELVNCTVVANSAGSLPAGLFMSGTDGDALNCIFYDNDVSGTQSDVVQVRVVSGGSLVLGYSLLEGWGGSLSGVTATVVSGSDPLFVGLAGDDSTLGTADDDASLGSGSPAIDAGNNSVGGLIQAVDIDLHLRPRFIDDPATTDGGSGTAPIGDIGAVEFLSPDCRADLNNDGDVDSTDLSLVLTNFGIGDGGDVDGDGDTDSTDLSLVNASFGNSCP